MTRRGPIDSRVDSLEQAVERMQQKLGSQFVTPAQVGRHSDFRIAEVANVGSTIGRSFLCKFVDGVFPDGGGNTEATWRDRQESAKITVYNLASSTPAAGTKLPVWHFRNRWWTFYQTTTSTPFEKFIAQNGYMFSKATSSVALSTHPLGTLICNSPSVSNASLRWRYTWPTSAFTYNESQLNLETRGNLVCAQSGMYTAEARLVFRLTKESSGISDPTVDEATMNVYVDMHRIKPSGLISTSQLLSVFVDVRDRDWETLTGNPPYQWEAKANDSHESFYEYNAVNYPIEAGDEVLFEYRIIGPDGFGTYVAPSGFAVGIFNAYSNLFGFSTHSVT